MDTDPSKNINPDDLSSSVPQEPVTNDSKPDTRDSKIVDLEEQLEKLHKESTEFKDKWLRSLAELDNFRKRILKEKKDLTDFAQQEIWEEIFPVLDNFDRALTTPLESEEAKKFAGGIALVDTQFHEILLRHGIEEIVAVGQPFDPHQHEAVLVIQTNEYPDHTVLEEIRKGYKKGDKIIRPTQVKVSQYKTE